jgi:hypothetical protein
MGLMGLVDLVAVILVVEELVVSFKYINYE